MEVGVKPNQTNSVSHLHPSPVKMEANRKPPSLGIETLEDPWGCGRRPVIAKTVV